MRIVEKKEGKPASFEMWGAERLHGHLYGQRKEAILKPYQDELLKKYGCEIFTSRLKAFDPVAK